MTNSLLLSSVRHVMRHPLHNALLVLALALGVALVVSIDLASTLSSRSFRLSAEGIAGRATHRVVGGVSGVDESLYVRLTVEEGLGPMAPVVEGYVQSIELARPMRLLGVDPLAEGPFRDYVALVGDGDGAGGVLTAFLTVPGSVLIEGVLAERYALGTGDVLRVRHGGKVHALEVAGLLMPGDSLARDVLGGMLIADISTAQEVLGMEGRLSSIDLIAGPEAERGTLEELAPSLPAGVRIETPGSRTEALLGMSRAFELNLFALSLLALVVAAFIAYNAVTFSILQRREQYGSMRAIGVTRRQIFASILLETVVIGAAGSVLGIALGVVLGQVTLRLVTGTVGELYYTLTAGGFGPSYASVVKGALLGLTASVLSGVVPALEASRVAPAVQLRRESYETGMRGLLPRLSAIGAALVLGGAAAVLLPGGGLGLPLAGMFLLLLGFSLLVPWTMSRLLMALEPLLALFDTHLLRMASRSVARSLGRTGVAAAALMVAVSVIVSVDIMIGSFRTTVESWLGYTLGADIFISLPQAPVSGEGGFGRHVADIVRGVEGVDGVYTARRVRLVTERYGPVLLVAIDRDIAEDRTYAWLGVERGEVRERMEDGWVMVSESFARRHDLSLDGGDVVTLPTDSGEGRFPVAAVYYDYSSGTGAVLMLRVVYDGFWRDTRVTSVAAGLRDGAYIGVVMQAVRDAVLPEGELLVQSRRSLRESALAVFDRTFRVTGSLRVLAGVVAFLGMLAALMSLQLERAREVATLRANGMTAGQLSRMLLMETGLIGAITGALSVPVGLIMALVLVYVINLRAFGWTLELTLTPSYFTEPMLIALGSALLAGLYPAYRLAGMNIAEALKSE